MSSGGNPGATWAPYDTYRDCSRGICSIYCPQWCYIIFPPPPPPPPHGNEDGDASSATTISPLIIALIGILASAFLLVSYYTIVTKYCRRRSGSSRDSHTDYQAHHDEVHPDHLQVGTVGLDETIIKSITVFKYRKIDKLVEGTECAVCLNEFLEEENLRLLPKCCHAFHPPCIDTWLKSQSNCPLCRANVNPFSPVTPNSQTNSSANPLEVERGGNDLVLVVENDEINLISHVCDDGPVRDGMEMEINRVITEDDDDQEGAAHQFRRSVSLGTCSSQSNLLVADIQRIHDEDNDSQPGIGIGIGIGSSKDGSREGDSGAAMRRSFSTGRFNFTDPHDDKGKMHLLPN